MRDLTLVVLLTTSLMLVVGACGGEEPEEANLPVNKIEQCLGTYCGNGGTWHLLTIDNCLSWNQTQKNGYCAANSCTAANCRSWNPSCNIELVEATVYSAVCDGTAYINCWCNCYEGG